MDFIFYGKISKKKKEEIRKLIVLNFKRLANGGTLGEHHSEYYNTVFISADCKNAQGNEIILLDLKSRFSGGCCHQILKPFREDSSYSIMDATGVFGK